MKIVCIHGQNHKGSTYHIGRMLADRFPDGEIREYFLPRDLDHFCLGCYRCVEKSEDCPFFEEKNSIMQAVEEAELLIFTTPTYCFHASASMKAFIDLTFTYWMSHKPRACMFSKKAVVLSTAAGAGAKSAVKDITKTLFYWGVPYIKAYGIAVQAMNWGQVSDKKKAKISADMDKLASKIQKKKPRVGFKTKFIFSMMRMMQLNNWGASKAEKAYWEENGWLGKKRPWR